MSWWQRFVKKLRGDSGADEPGGCDHSTIALRQGTAEFEWFVAQAEIEAGHSLKHGASHLANLLLFDPGHAEWVELLERYLAAAGSDPESLIPRGEQLYTGTEALRAYIWHKQGRLADAIVLLVNVVEAKKTLRYLETWGLSWLEPLGVMETLPLETGLRLLSSTLIRFPEARQSPLPQLREVERWARLAERLGSVHPDNGQLLMFTAGLLRKAGRLDDAEAAVERAMGPGESWYLATALGLILREKGDPEGAAEAFRVSQQIDPNNFSVYLEAGDTFFGVQQWPAALAWYDELLAREPHQEWAMPSALYCRWKMSGEEKHLNEVVALMKAGDRRAGILCQRAFWAEPDEPSDATASLLRHFRQSIVDDPSKAPQGEIRIGLACLEAPSNHLAFRLEGEAIGRELRLRMAVDRVPSPDPREPIADVKYRIWTYDGIQPIPNLPPPSADVVERVAALASIPYDELTNWAGASRAAEALGPERVGEILAVLVHPPAVPQGKTALA